MPTATLDKNVRRAGFYPFYRPR